MEGARERGRGPEWRVREWSQRMHVRICNVGAAGTAAVAVRVAASGRGGGGGRPAVGQCVYAHRTPIEDTTYLVCRLPSASTLRTCAWSSAAMVVLGLDGTVAREALP